MKDYIQTHIHIALTLVGVALAIAIGSWFAHASIKALEHEVRLQIQGQKDKLYELAVITDKNGVNEEGVTIIADCTRRGEFDALLSNIASLEKRDLITLQNLFEGCGDFYAKGKALMVLQMSSELQKLIESNSLLIALSVQPLNHDDLARWNSLVSLEKKRSQLLIDQSDIQAKIITELISGSTPSAESVRVLVQDAEKIAKLFPVYDDEIDTVRSNLEK